MHQIVELSILSLEPHSFGFKCDKKIEAVVTARNATQVCA